MNGGESGQPGQPTNVAVNQVAMFKEVRFFCDPNASDCVFSVKDDESARIVEGRGHEEIHANHFADRGASLPPLVSDRQTAVQDNLEVAPVMLTLPNGKKIPELWKASKTESAATAIVRAVEDRVVDREQQKAHSPCRLWTPEERKKHGVNDAKMTKCFQACHFVHVVHHGQDTEMIRTSLKDTAKEAAEKIRQDTEIQSNEIARPKWFDVAVQMHNDK